MDAKLRVSSGVSREPFTETVDSTPIAWILGELILILMYLPTKKRQRH